MEISPGCTLKISPNTPRVQRTKGLSKKEKDIKSQCILVAYWLSHQRQSYINDPNAGRTSKNTLHHLRHIMDPYRPRVAGQRRLTPQYPSGLVVSNREEASKVLQSVVETSFMVSKVRGAKNFMEPIPGSYVLLEREPPQRMLGGAGK
ncbi:hypothetical protein J6590_093789 [Homalodisca vitripennis]|nr:hypothetical protein J6590_093789 [Homalodisca vitripennis]